MLYFCTACGDIHEGDFDTPLTAEEIFDRNPDAPQWLADYANDTEHPACLCEDCYGWLLIDGDRNFPPHDLLEPR